MPGDVSTQAVLTVGSFDGVHLGHQAIIRFLVESARTRGGVATLVTFDPHPREVVSGAKVPLLTTPAERAAIVSSLGVSQTVVLPFDREMARMQAEEFVSDILVREVGMSCIVIGYDHGFGAGRRGNRELLTRMGPVLGFHVDVIPPQQVQHAVVSSTRVRQVLMEEGDCESASALLGRPYRWSGLVVEGDKRGRTIGYPTANLKPSDDRKVLPLSGVYAVVVTGADGVRHPGMMNIGSRPTFDGVGMHQEVHILDFEGNLYGESLTVEFRVRLRDERRFAGVDELVEQLRMDEARCRISLNGVI